MNKDKKILESIKKINWCIKNTNNHNIKIKLKNINKCYEELLNKNFKNKNTLENWENEISKSIKNSINPKKSLELLNKILQEEKDKIKQEVVSVNLND